MKNYSIFVISRLNTIAKKLRQPNFLRDFGIPSTLVLLGLSVTYYLFNRNPPPRLWDFHNAYYPAGRIVLENPQGLYHGDTVVFGFVNLPILAYLFTPLSLLNEPAAEVLFMILGLLAVFVAGYSLIKLTKVSGWRRTILIGLLATNQPLYNSIRIGNTTHFVLLLLIGSFFCLRARHDIWNGVLLASAALIKIPLLYMIIYFAIRGRLRVVAAFCTTLLVIIGSSLLLFGFDLHLTWFNKCILAFSGKAISGYNAQSVDSFLIRLLTNFPVDSWIPIDVDWKFKLIRYVIVSLLVGIPIWVCWYLKRPQTFEAESSEVSIFLCLGLIISPISWSHYYLFLLIPLAMYIGSRLAIPKKWSWNILMLLCILLVSLPHGPTNWFNNPLLRVLARGFLVPHHFIGGVLFIGILLAARWQASKNVSTQQF